MLQRLLIPLLPLLASPAAPAIAPQGADRTAAEITSSSGDLDQLVQVQLTGRGRTGGTERSILLLLDPTRSVQQAGFAAALSDAIGRSRQRLAATRLGLAVLGAEDLIQVPLTTAHQDVAQAVQSALREPDDEIKNVYHAIRRGAASLHDAPGERRILLVSLENGDAEDDLEETVRELRKHRVRLHAIAGEAYLADSYWVRRRLATPRGTTLMGGDAPVIDLPWGWMFQRNQANEVSPSSFALYGVSRVASGSGGDVALFTPSNQAGHRCGLYMICPFCDGREHLVHDEVYKPGRLSALAPPTGSRDDELNRLADDPWFTRTMAAWREASRKGLVASNPSTLVEKGRAKTQAYRGLQGLAFAGLAFKRHAQRADRAAKDCAAILSELERDRKRLGPDAGLPRQRAHYELTRLLLQVTRINLMLFAGWCREVGPEWEKGQPGLSLPLIPEDLPETRPDRILIENWPLCHGAAPFLELDLPAAQKVRPELLRLDAMLREFLLRYGGTPWALAIHQTGIAWFRFNYPNLGAVRRTQRRGSKTANTPTTPRPSRSGASGSRGASGPTTGRGR